MKRSLALESNKSIEQQVMLMGWVNSRRDHGGVIFIDIRDESGIVQLTIHPDHKEAFEVAETVRDEYVLKASGKVINREAGLINKDIATGEIEIVVEELEILNKSDPLPFSVSKDNQVANEETRLKYRYLDLRREKMQRMLKRRSEMYSYIRKYMEKNDFTEITTPILANSSPEGARDFVIPSRFQQGKFYALPQAPQQFKQLLMVGGVPRYYQLAACFRDEDPRADRLYGEFYQLDMEMAFVEDGDEVRKMMDPLMTELVTDFAGKKLTFKNVPRITHDEAMNTYGSDKPDLRYDMKLTDLSDDFADTKFSVFGKAIKDGGVVKAINVKGASTLSRKEIDAFTEIAMQNGAKGLAYILFTETEIKSPIAKFMTEQEIEAIKTKFNVEDGDGIFFGAGIKDEVNKVLGAVRVAFADHFKLKNPDEVSLLWVVDFPIYEWDEKQKKIDFGHNPFSMPRGGLEAIQDAETDEEKLALVADQYDLVMNGYEVSSGAVRNYKPEVMYAAFEVVGISRETVDERFGAMISAFKYGAPPHAGNAPGLDRIFMVLMNEDNIREVVAFPKNGSGVDLMMQSPSSVSPEQLTDLSIEVVEQTEK